MENVEFWMSYVITVFVASIIPGPSMILSLTHSLRYGEKNAIYTAFGNSLASILQAIIALTGLSIVLTTSTILFTIIKYVGSLYLIFLGFKLFTASFTINENKKIKVQKNRLNLFMEGFIVAISNPKALVFFTALFPHFITESKNNIIHNFLLVSILGLIAFICMIIYSFGANYIKKYLENTTISKFVGRIIGSMFIGFGLNLLFSKR